MRSGERRGKRMNRVMEEEEVLLLLRSRGVEGWDMGKVIKRGGMMYRILIGRGIIGRRSRRI